jgi:hypothetical protein
MVAARMQPSAMVASRVTRGGVLLVSTLVVLFARRPDQFLHPYVWVEDGVYTLSDYVQRGAWIITEPMAGYLPIASKLISYVAYRSSILWAPEIETALVVALTCAVIFATAFSPTHLRWPLLCAVAVLLVPTDAEVFVVSSYAFWWGGLLLPLALLWDSARGFEPLRWIYIVFGGLSSPIVIPIAALFWLRAVIERHQTNLFAAMLATLVSVMQIVAIHYQPIEIQTATIGVPAAMAALRQFIGAYFHLATPTLAALVIAGVIAFAAWRIRDKLDRWFMLLVLTFAALCTSVALRMPLDALQGIHPFSAGPRYFFYPFILLSWIMIWIASLSAKSVRLLIGAAMCGAVMFALPGMSRRHDPVNWREQILACAQASGPYTIPIHYIGHRRDMWRAELTGDDCRKLIRQSLF